MTGRRPRSAEAPTSAHAARPVVWASWALGGVCVPLAVVTFAGGGLTGGIILLGLGGASMGLGRSLGLRIPAAQLVNRAVQQLTRGQFAAAEELLASVSPQAAKDGIIARGTATLRALIALYEGRIEEAESYATAAIQPRLGILTRSFEMQQVATAHGVRALARAARSDAAGAKADADIAESSVDATPEVIARSRVVRALLASRAAYHEEAFRAYIVANARLVLEHAMPRERALFRALRRMAKSPHKSVYREPARMKGDHAPSRLASWIGLVAPEAAGYVDGDRMFADAIEETPIASGVPSDVRALRTARAGKSSARLPGGSTARILGLGGVLVALLVVLWQVLAPPGTAAPAPAPVEAAHATATAASVIATAIVDLVPIVFAALAFIILMSFGRRQQRALAIGRRLAALGDRTRATPALVELVTSRNGMIAAGAGLELARMAAHRADFAETISRCDAAIARVDKQPARATAADMLLPALMAESAVAMAARGGIDEAAAELAVLGRDFPSYGQLASAQLRVRLISAVRTADRDAACAIAKARTASMPLPYREDVLADLLLASRGEVPEDDLERLESELRDSEELRTWLDAIAPGLREDGPMKARVAFAARAPEIEADAEPEHAPAPPPRGASPG